MLGELFADLYGEVGLGDKRCRLLGGSEPGVLDMTELC